MSDLLYNEELISPSGDLDSLRLAEPTTQDGLGAEVASVMAFRVSTYGELALALEHAAGRRLLVRPAGAFTSSKAFVSPSANFMREFDRTGVALVSFDPKGVFGQIQLDLARGQVTVGPAVTLQQLSDYVSANTINGSGLPRLESRLNLTTMDAHAVATAMGSGGVSDRGDSGLNLMREGWFMDGRGIVHTETYDTVGYFDSNSSSFARVDHLQVGKQMSGRGGPFGIGVQATFKLSPAPLSHHTVIIPFSGSAAEVRDGLCKLILQANRANRRLVAGQDALELVSLELMDRHAMAVARQGLGQAPFHFDTDPELIVIADFSQYDHFGDAGMVPWESADFLERLINTDLFESRFLENAVLPDGPARMEVRKFRLMGPEHMRSLIKRSQLAGGVKLGTDSTDFAVDAGNDDLVSWYFDEFFRVYDAAQSKVVHQALYGHLLNRLDMHHRVAMPPTDLIRHSHTLLELGRQFVERQKAGAWVRVRGEKVELPFGRDLELIGKQREGDHRDSNRRLLKRLDPHGLFRDRAPERWRGNFDWR